MIQYVIRRVTVALFSILASVTIVFFALRLLPGDPATAILGDSYSPQAATALRARLGLDKPLHIQFGAFLADLLRFDLGTSLQTGRPVRDLLLEMGYYSSELMVGALLLGVLIGVALGVVSAVYRDRFVDNACRVLASAGYAVPVFFLGAVLLYVFAVRLRIVPLIGTGAAGKDFAQRMYYAALPAATLSTVLLVLIARLLRTSLVEEYQKQYVTTARGKGLSEARVVLRHALRNALIPVLIMVGVTIPRFVEGAALVEVVFTRPGLGRTLVGAVSGRDYPVVQAIIVLMTFIVTGVNLLCDLGIGLLDPRIRYD